MDLELACKHRSGENQGPTDLAEHTQSKLERVQITRVSHMTVSQKTQQFPSSKHGDGASL